MGMCTACTWAVDWSIVVNGVDAMKECFVRQGEYFAGRPDSYLKKLTKSKGM